MENNSKRIPKDLIRMRCEMRTARDRLNNASKMIDTVLAICGQMPDSDYREQLVQRYLEIAKFDAPEFFKEDTSKSAASELLDKARNSARDAADKADAAKTRSDEACEKLKAEPSSAEQFRDLRKKLSDEITRVKDGLGNGHNFMDDRKVVDTFSLILCAFNNINERTGGNNE